MKPKKLDTLGLLYRAIQINALVHLVIYVCALMWGFVLDQGIIIFLSSVAIMLRRHVWEQKQTIRTLIENAEKLASEAPPVEKPKERLREWWRGHEETT